MRVLQFGGGAPKGVFRYRNAAEANRDQERWIGERVRRRMDAIRQAEGKPPGTP